MNHMQSIPEVFSLKGKVGVVTGAAGLLGRYHCQALSEAGANVVAIDLCEQKCSQIARELAESTGVECIGIKGDVTDGDCLANIRTQILRKFDHIDILVNNAAINEKVEDCNELTKFENFPLSLWQKSINVNLTSVFLCSQIFGSDMARTRCGSIINIASTYGIVAPDQSLYQKRNGEQSFYKSAAYSTTKGAVIAFTRYLAAYWGKNGVRVNALVPGGVENDQESDFIDHYSQRTPLGRMAQPWEYKSAIVFLAGNASSYMTGASLVVDGGWTAW